MRTPGRLPTLLGLAAALLLAGSASAQERFRKTPPPPDPTPELRLPNVETYTLSNGLAISTVFREGQPFINIQLIVGTGEADSPRLSPGTASFAANMIVRGTIELSAGQILERIEAMGGRLSVNTRVEATVFTFQFLEEYLDQALDLLSQIILHPAFSDVELGVVRYNLYYDLLDKEKDASFVGKRQLLRELFRNHAYRAGFFNKDVLKNIKTSEVSRFYQTHYYPNWSHIVLTGNLSLRAATRKVSHFFNTWARGPEPRPALPLPPPNDELRVIFVDIPQAQEAMVFVGNVVPAMTSPAYFPLLVFQQVMGGSVNSRLMLNLRETKGYAYYAFSQVETYPGFDLFVVRARLAPEFVHASVEEVLNELRRNGTAPLPTAEVEQAKTFLLGRFPLTIERLENLAERIADLKLYDLADDFWSRYEENILLVNDERVFRLVQSLPLLTPVVVIAGDKRVLADQLKSFDKVDIFDAQGTFQYSLVKETEK
jgi:zinc protease